MTVGLHHVEIVMGMAVSIDVRDPHVPAGAITEVVDWLHHVDATFSPYKDSSPITMFGRGEITWDELTDEIRNVLVLCEVLQADTAGAFDIARVPAPNGTTFDPSGLVKGWSIERAAGILESWSATDFCINAGGDIVLRGEPLPAQPWRIGIRHPDVANKLATVVVAGGPLAIATSATYERGQHIIDPRSGRPATSLASVTVVGPDLTLADAYATAVFVMGIDGVRWLAEHDGYGAFVITRDGMTHRTSTFDQYREGSLSSGLPIPSRAVPT
jgi:FAD:protein FMN transferase